MHKFRGCHLTTPTSESERTKGTVVTPLKFPPNIPIQNNETLSKRTVNFTTGKAVAEIGTSCNHLMENTFQFWVNKDTA